MALPALLFFGDDLFGPAAVSKNLNDLANESMNKVIISSSTFCTNNTVNAQSININNVNSGVGCSLNINNIEQKITDVSETLCSQSNDNITELRTAFETELTQAATAKAEGLFPPSTVTENINRLVTNISSTIDYSAVVSAVNSVKNGQALSVSELTLSCPAFCLNTVPDPDIGYLYFYCANNISDLTQDISSLAITKVLSENTSLQTVIQSAALEIDQIATSESKGLTLPSFGFVLIILAVLILLGGSFLKGAIGALLPIIALGIGIFLAVYFWNKTPTWARYVGIALIVLGLVLIIFKFISWRNSKKPTGQLSSNGKPPPMPNYGQLPPPMPAQYGQPPPNYAQFAPYSQPPPNYAQFATYGPPNYAQFALPQPQAPVFVTTPQ